ncbi:SLC35A4 upstream open reading frame protein-like [Cyprinus carpio]|uniref:SLC35A4 upstream open reading frame protein-like n=1 Tax=Cyprinus carpio TaxID=7962 RepID=A0A9Q9YU59_CYPCA|nr:SLC35A4 upstream open reading frame protein-like [Cyprinus carpio]
MWSGVVLYGLMCLFCFVLFWCGVVWYGVFCFCFVYGLGGLKDLAQLKDQLEEIQKKVENEVQAGIPQGGSLLASPFLKGFLAGYVISKLRSSAVLGVALGTLTGIYAAQNYQVPNIETSLRDFLSSLKKGPSD